MKTRSEIWRSLLNTVCVLDAWAPSVMTRAIRIERPPELTLAFGA